ncbi:MAG: chloride channel protein [Corynebacterium sp.]|nr:chloride channel protein [Corynebacterium sp.]
MRWLMYGTYSTNFLHAHSNVHTTRMILVPIIGGALIACLWYVIRARTQLVSVESATEGTKLPFIGTMADALTQLIAVGAGFSIGREGAPRQMAAACIDVLGKLKAQVPLFKDLDDPDRRRMIISCGAAAALASVYGAPWAGIPFALTTLYGAWTVAGVIASGAICWIAAEVAWSVVGHKPVLYIGSYNISDFPRLGWVLLVIPLAPILAWGFSWLMDQARGRSNNSIVVANPGQVLGRYRKLEESKILGMTLVGVITALVGIVLPQSLGNGSATLYYDVDKPDVAMSAGLGISVALLIIKPLLTAISLRSGMAGGLLMPSASTGAAFGSTIFFLLAMGGLVPTHVGVFIVFCAAGAGVILGITNKSMAFAILCVIEITGMPYSWAAVLVGVGVLTWAWNYVFTHWVLHRFAQNAQ